MRVRRFIVGPAVAFAAGIGLAGCGSSGGNGIAHRAPAEIVTRATRAIDGVRSVRVTGAIADGDPAHPIRLSIQLVNDRGAVGSMVEDGVGFRLIAVDDSAYINGSPGFWRRFGGAAVAARLQGHWLRAPASSGTFASLQSLTDVRRLLSDLLSGHGPLTRGATSTVNGHRVIALRDSSRHGTLDVATTGPPYPIRLVNSGARGGSLDFGAFNARVTLAPPAHAVSLPGLTG